MKMTKEYKNYRRKTGMVDLEKEMTTTATRKRLKAYKVDSHPIKGKWIDMYSRFKGVRYEEVLS
jgi:hypothetical protein